MTATMTGNLPAVIDNHDQRITALEQTTNDQAPSALTGPVEVTDPDTGYVAILDINPPDVPTGVAAVPGTFFDDIFVDVSWTGAANSYEVELAKHTIGPPETRDLIDLQVVYATTCRFTALQPNATYSVRVTAVSPLGIHSAASAWVDFATGADTTIPAAPTGLQTFRSADAIIASWNENAEVDVAKGHGLYLVQLSADNFATILQQYRISATVVAFEGILTEQNYKVRVAAIDSSGNQSPYTTSADTLAGSIITTQIKDDAITTPKIIAGAVTATQIAAATITAAKIAVGTITGDRISANTITGDKITTSDLTTATITLNGGALKAGNPPTTGLLMNSQGLRLYQSGVQTIILDAATGNATFSGTVSGANITATSTIQGSTISGAVISGGTITGSTIQTSTTVPKVVIKFHPASDSTPPWNVAVTYEAIEIHTSYTGGTQDFLPGLLTAKGGTNTTSGNPQAYLEFRGPSPESSGWPTTPYLRLGGNKNSTSFLTCNADTVNFIKLITSTDLTVLGNLTVSGSATLGSVTLNSPTITGTVAGTITFSGAITFNQNIGVTGTSFLSAVTCSSISASSTVTATAFSASSGSSLLRGINNSSQGISNAGAISGATTISASSTITGTAFSATSGTSFFQGIVGTTLAISGAKMFVIEHPLDPKRALAHACIEGPEFGVYQRGSATIGRDGTVVVKLPVYVEALWREEDRAVQLTAVHDPKIKSGPLSATYPKDGEFMIVGPAGLQVWWQVNAIRADIDPLGVEWLKEDEYWFGERPLAEEVVHEDPTQTKEHVDAV